MHPHWNWIIFTSAIFTLRGLHATIVKDATFKNIAMQTSRKSNIFNNNVTEFRANDIVFIEGKPATSVEVLKRLALTEDASSITLITRDGSQALDSFQSVSLRDSAFRLVQDSRPLTLFNIAEMLRIKEVYFVRPTQMNIEGESVPLTEIIDTYAADLKSDIAVRYTNNDEYFFYENERIGITQLYNIIFQRPNFVFSFASLELNSMKLPFDRLMYTMAYVPNLKIILEGQKMEPKDFLKNHPNFKGKVQLEFEGVVDDLVDVFKQTMKYTIVDFLMLPNGMVAPYHALRSLQHLSEMEAWRPAPGNKPQPLSLFLNNVFPDEDPKQNLMQVFYRGSMLTIQNIIELLMTEGHIVFGDMSYAEKLPRDKNYQIKFGKHIYSIDNFLDTYGRTSSYYEVMDGKRTLSLKELEHIKRSNLQVNTTKITTTSMGIMSMFGVSFRLSELAYNLAHQKPRHVMIKYMGVTYTPEQFIDAFHEHVPENFTIEKNGVEISINDVFKVLNINTTPQFLKMYKIMNISYKGQQYTKDDILMAILENPDGFMILDNGQFMSPLSFKEHYGDNVPEFVIYYKDRPIKPDEISAVLDLEKILEDEFYPILYNGHSYSPLDVVRMLYNQQPDKVKILHKERKYTPEEYLETFPSTKFQILYNDYRLPAEDLEQIIDFDLKFPKSKLRIHTIKYKNVTYSKDDILDILIQQGPPNVKILHEGVFYLPKQFKRQFSTKPPDNFAVVQNRRIIPSKLLPTIIRLGDAKQTNPKIFPNIFYNGKEYTPDDILNMIIAQNPADVTIALRTKRFTPKQFEKVYDGVYPITYSILFKDVVLTPEQIVNIVDFEDTTTEVPSVVIYTTSLRSDVPRVVSIEEVSDDLVPPPRRAMMEEDDFTMQNRITTPQVYNSPEDHTQSSLYEPSKMRLPPSGEGMEPDARVVDMGPSSTFSRPKQFPYVVHNGQLFSPEDVVKSVADMVSKKTSPTKWTIRYNGIEYIPAEFLKIFANMPREFKIIEDEEEVLPEHIAQLVPLQNHGVVINEESKDGKIFPHLVIDGVIYTPQHVLHCLINQAANETYILHSGRTYHPSTFKQQFPGELPDFKVVYRNETVPKEKLPSILDFNRQVFMTTEEPTHRRTTLSSSYQHVSSEGDEFSTPPTDTRRVVRYGEETTMYPGEEFATTPWDTKRVVIFKDGSATATTKPEDYYINTGTSKPPINPEITISREVEDFHLKPNSNALPKIDLQDDQQRTTPNYPKRVELFEGDSSYDSSETVSRENSGVLTTSTELPTQFPYIVYNGSIFSPYEVVKSLKDQKPENVTVIVDQEEFNPKDFYEYYTQHKPENFDIYKNGRHVPPSDIPRIVEIDSHVDYDYEDKTSVSDDSKYPSVPNPAHIKPTISSQIIQQILKDNPNTRVVINDKEYEPNEVAKWNISKLNQDDIRIVDDVPKVPSESFPTSPVVSGEGFDVTRTTPSTRGVFPTSDHTQEDDDFSVTPSYKDSTTPENASSEEVKTDDPDTQIWPVTTTTQQAFSEEELPPHFPPSGDEPSIVDISEEPTKKPFFPINDEPQRPNQNVVTHQFPTKSPGSSSSIEVPDYSGPGSSEYPVIDLNHPSHEPTKPTKAPHGWNPSDSIEVFTDEPNTSIFELPQKPKLPPMVPGHIVPTRPPFGLPMEPLLPIRPTGPHHEFPEWPLLPSIPTRPPHGTNPSDSLEVHSDEPTKPSYEFIMPTIPPRGQPPSMDLIHEIPKRPQYELPDELITHTRPTKPTRGPYSSESLEVIKGEPTLPPFAVADLPNRPTRPDGMIVVTGDPSRPTRPPYELPELPALPVAPIRPTGPRLDLPLVPTMPTRPPSGSYEIHVDDSKEPHIEVLEQPNFPTRPTARPSLPDSMEIYRNMPTRPSFESPEISLVTKPTRAPYDLPEMPLVPVRPVEPHVDLADAPSIQEMPTRPPRGPSSSGSIEITEPHFGLPRLPIMPTRPTRRPGSSESLEIYNDESGSPPYEFHEKPLIQKPIRPLYEVPELPLIPSMPTRPPRGPNSYGSLEITDVDSTEPTFSSHDLPTRPSVLIGHPDLPDSMEIYKDEPGRPSHGSPEEPLVAKPTRPPYELPELSLIPSMPTRPPQGPNSSGSSEISYELPEFPSRPKKPTQDPNFPDSIEMVRDEPTRPPFEFPEKPVKPLPPRPPHEFPEMPLQPMEPIELQHGAKPTRPPFKLPEVPIIPSKPTRPALHWPEMPLEPLGPEHRPGLPLESIELDQRQDLPSVMDHTIPPSDIVTPTKPSGQPQMPTRPSYKWPEMPLESIELDQRQDLPSVMDHTIPPFDIETPTRPSEQPQMPTRPPFKRPEMPSQPIAPGLRPDIPSVMEHTIPSFEVEMPTRPKQPSSIEFTHAIEIPTRHPIESQEKPLRPTIPTRPPWGSVPLDSIEIIQAQPTIPSFELHDLPNRPTRPTRDPSSQESLEVQRDESTRPSYELSEEPIRPSRPNLEFPELPLLPINPTKPPQAARPPLEIREMPTTSATPGMEVIDREPSKPQFDLPDLPGVPSRPTRPHYLWPDQPSLHMKPENPIHSMEVSKEDSRPSQEWPLLPLRPVQTTEQPLRPTMTPAHPWSDEDLYPESSTDPNTHLPQRPMRPGEQFAIRFTTMPPPHHRHNLVINREGNVFDEVDIIRGLDASNPNNVRIVYKQMDYTPSEFLHMYPNPPKDMDIKYVLGSKQVEPYVVASLISNQTRSEPDMTFPNVVKNGVTYTPKDVVRELAKDPEGQCVQVVYNGQLYTPREFYEMFDSSSKFPNNFQMQVSGRYMDPKIFLSVFKVLDKDGKSFEHNSYEATKKPNIVVPYIKKAMSKEPNFEVIYRGVPYEPARYIEIFGDNPPDHFRIRYQDEVMSPIMFYNILKTKGPTSRPFPNVSFEGEQYTPHLVMESLAVANPNRIKVHYQGENYSPMQFIARYDPLPTNFELLDSHSRPIDPKDTSKYMKQSYSSGRKGLSIERSKFPILVSNGAKFSPLEVLENIDIQHANIQVQLTSGQVITARQALSMHNTPSEFELIHNGMKIPPIQVARILQLKKY